jgi:TatD DNase family protein
LEADLKIIEEKIQYENCLAIGECGLDKKIEQPLALQLLVFEKQLALAEKYNKPVVIHCVAAFQELIVIKKKMKISVPMIIHGFAKKGPLAEQLIKEGFYISFGKQLLKNPALQSVFQSIPNDRFFLETDIMEENIQVIYDVVGNIKSLSYKELKEVISSNFKAVFRKSELL